MLEKKTEQLTDQVAFILMNNMFANTNAVYKGLEVLKNVIRQFISEDKPIELLLPAFPCKSVNPDKVIGKLPDMGEYLVLRKFVNAIRDIEAIYCKGAVLTIFSDYHTFSDYISVDLNDHYDYSDGLHRIVDGLNANEIIKIVNFHNFPVFDDVDEANYLNGLREKFGNAQFEAEFDDLVKIDEKANDAYLGLKKFMREDQHYQLQALNNRGKKARLSEIAKGMMVQGKALDNFLNEHFPHHIRLSIHSHPMDGKKFALYLFDDREFKTPWHNTILFDATIDAFVTEPVGIHYRQCDEGREVILPCTLNDQNWLLIKLSSETEETFEKLKGLKLSLYREKCGLLIDNVNHDLTLYDLDNEQITALNKHFGVLVFRGFKTFEQPQQLEDWYGTRGNMIPWKFGFTHVVAPVEGHQGKPLSSVDSEEGLPIHWDLLAPPSYMGINQVKFQYKDFIPREFMLYCHRNEPENLQEDGISLLIDSSHVPLTIPGRLREKYRKTELSYSTKLTYFGGEPKSYPLMMKCPWTFQDVMRWWEVWSDDDHPGTIQPNYSKIVTSEDYDDMAALEAELREICMSERNMFKHQMEPGDAVLINNHTMLHGRTDFKGYRELWRIQMQPPSLNSPWKDFLFQHGKLQRRTPTGSVENIE